MIGRIVSLGLKPPFGVKRLACLEGNEQLVDSVVHGLGQTHNCCAFGQASEIRKLRRVLAVDED